MSTNKPSSNAVTVTTGQVEDTIEFAVLTEIGIINQLSQNMFQARMPDDMTVAQFTVLNHLLRLDVQQTISELASAIQVTQPTMSSTVRKLEDKGLVTLEHDPDDRRTRRVCVTEAGIEMRKSATDQLAPMIKQVRSDMPLAVWQNILPELSRIRKYLDEMRD
ncbi:MarR family transcriptional regulator [Parasphingorhabdus sp.]|uniref:MarR family winged helix-turn-helix transcriptional regulator n=1 Tax=Parasphingorhabdus sp. TaxID=2709688 RepID=UPI003266196F